MKESRLFRIVYYLLEKGTATATDLAEELEVSVRTIYRDIDMISSAGIPIYASQGRGGGISILENYVLEKSLFSETEQEQILMALQGIAMTNENNSNELLIKLGAIFQTKSSDWIEIDFSNWVQNEVEQDIFEEIKKSIFNHNVISFRYFSNNGNTERQVQPIKLVFKSRDWYLYGLCLLKNDYRFFKLTRIKALNILSETFIRQDIPTTIKKKIETPRMISVLLKFDRRIAFRVYDEFTDKITKDEYGNLFVQTELPDNDILYSYILSFANYVEVVEPKEIRDRIIKNIENIQKVYKT